jgi:hypothetical protein
VADYFEWQPSTHPAWLSLTQGEAWGMFWGYLKDAWAEGAKEAVKARHASTGAPDALSEQAGDRGLEQYPNESQATFRVRLAQSFDRLQLLGTVQGLLDAALAVPGVLSVTYREARDVDPDAPLWATNPGGLWARWWLLVRVSWPLAAPWDSGWAWDDGWRWDFASGEAGPLLIRQLQRWKAAHTRGMVIIASPDAVVTNDSAPERVPFGGWSWSGGQVSDVPV